MEKHAVYSGTRNLYGDMQTAAKSLIANSDVDKVWMLTEGGYDYWLPDMCEVIDVSGQLFFPPDGPNMSTQYTYMAMLRCCLALMPEFAGIDRILSLDVDTIANRRVSDVWELPLGDEYYFAAVRENHRSVGNLLYTNIGVALMNLAKLRNGKADEFVDALNRWQFRWIEQDVMNYLCQGRILQMPPEYNACDFTDHSFVRIRHYAARSADRWRGERLVQQYREMSWDRALELHDWQVSKNA
jgi:lipopolysaccharide biosynthesis glycosyltransferase